MINRKIAISAISIFASLALMAGATYAYFTGTATSSTNTFTAGTLKISIDQRMQIINPVISNWAPGNETQVRFDVNNTGTLPVNLRGYALGHWTGDFPQITPDPTLVKITRVEYYNEGLSSWITLFTSPTGITGYFFYSPDGTNNNLYELAGGATEQLRLTVLFDSASDNNYQDHSYDATITVDAKQLNAPTF
jgi:predicted ribosomally synthesized peptide with SipW-like signal peptide